MQRSEPGRNIEQKGNEKSRHGVAAFYSSIFLL